MPISDKATIHESAVVGEGTKIEPGAVIYENCRIGKECVIGANAVLRPNTVIGDSTIFGPLSMSQGDVVIGSNTTVSPQSHITKGMSIGSSVFIAPNVMTANTPKITTSEHGTSQNKARARILPPKVEDHVRIGTGVTIMPDIVIGHHSLIAARCVLTKNVPPYSFVIGGKDQIGQVV